MQPLSEIDGYKYANAALNPSHKYLLPKVFEILEREVPGRALRIFDLGCGNGSVANELVKRGHEVVGIDASLEGIAAANAAYPHLSLHQASVYDDLAATYGSFDVVISLEVVPHLCFPRCYARTALDLLKDGGVVIMSTPYHGYWKNLLLALTGQLNAHFRPLWDYGYVKFWSIETLSALLSETGFRGAAYEFAGRFWPLSQSMIAIARK